MKLTPIEFNTLKKKGYTDEEIADAMSEADIEAEELQNTANATKQIHDPRTVASNSEFSTSYNDNLIQWQLEMDSICERIEHNLRGDKIKFVEGSIVWVKPENEDEEILNEKGVREIMRIVTIYLNRNTILSNYDEETIDEKMYDLGNEVADLIYLKYEQFGLNTLEKRKLYPMLVRQIIDPIHSAYLRALNGGERESLRESRHVTQNQPIGMEMQQQVPKERGILNPMRWIKGRY